ncbi:MAG: ChbG/HpnK family deacetylase, partial [Planctomycetaceae bacterium]
FPEIARYAAEHPGRDFGGHLTLTSEWRDYRWGPLAPRARVASVVDADGSLWRTTQQVVEHVKANEAEIEWRAQIECACRFAVRISHIDFHMDVGVCRPDLAEVYAELAAEYHLPALFVRTESGPPAGYVRAARLAEARQLAMLDALHQFYFRGSYESRRTLYLNTLRTLEPGVSQIILYCGYDDDELRAITPSISIRDSDRRIVTDPEVMAAIQEHGIETISWRQLLALPRLGRELPHGA